MGMCCQLGVEFPTKELKTQFKTECQPGSWEKDYYGETLGVEGYWNSTRNVIDVENYLSGLSYDNPDSEFTYWFCIMDGHPEKDGDYDITTTSVYKGGVVISEEVDYQEVEDL